MKLVFKGFMKRDITKKKMFNQKRIKLIINDKCNKKKIIKKKFLKIKINK